MSEEKVKGFSLEEDERSYEEVLEQLKGKMKGKPNVRTTTVYEWEDDPYSVSGVSVEVQDPETLEFVEVAYEDIEFDMSFEDNVVRVVGRLRQGILEQLPRSANAGSVRRMRRHRDAEERS